MLFTNLRLLDRRHFRPVLMLPKAGPIIQELTDRGIDYVIWGPLTEMGNVGAGLKALWRMMRFIRREKIDLIHVNHADSWRPAELMAARLMGVPVITHMHTIDDNPTPYVRHSTAILAVSDYVAKHSAALRATKFVVYNPVDLARFDAARNIRRELGFGNDEVLVSFVGQIRIIKGVGDFIAMAHKICDPRARFLIAGECRDPRKFEGAYSEADLKDAFAGDDRLRYLGYLERVEDLYLTSDIIVMPSRWQEPLGLIGIEAGACGRPVVATRSGGIPEVVVEGETGYLVEIGDVEALAERTARLIGDASLRKRMGEAARRRVESGFTTAPVRVLESIYQRMVGYKE